MFIDENVKYRVIEKISSRAFQALWVELQFERKSNIICGVIYRQHNSPESFQTYFDETIEKLSNSGKPIYVLGDFNINLLNAETCNFTKDFLLSLQSYSFIPTIDKPTRVNSNSATLIDNIFVNQIGREITSGNIISDVSDHYSQFCIIKSLKVKELSPKTMIRNFSRDTEENIHSELSEINWDLAMRNCGDNADAGFSKFFNSLNKIVNKHAPLRPLSKRKAKQFSKPWITKGILKSIKVKNALFTSGNYEKYKHYRNKILTLTRCSKKSYYHSYFNDHMTNVKKTWIGINHLIGRNKRRCKPIVALPNVLNDFFSSVGQTLAASVHPANYRFSDYLSTINISSSFFFEPVTSMELETEILFLPTNKAHGLYSCPVRVLKSSSSVLSQPLAQIMNISVITGQYPSKLKHAKVIPIFKGGDETDPSNYRPISLLSLFNRLFEKVMYNRLKILY